MKGIGHPASEPYFKRVRNELGAIAMELLAANMEAARSDAASRGPAPLLSFDGRYHVRTNNQSPHATATCVNLASNCLVAAVRSAPFKLHVPHRECTSGVSCNCQCATRWPACTVLLTACVTLRCASWQLHASLDATGVYRPVAL